MKNAFSKENIKTTLAGLGSILTGLGSLLTTVFDSDAGTNPDWTVIISAVVIGVGLICARDSAKKE